MNDFSLDRRDFLRLGATAAATLAIASAPKLAYSATPGVSPKMTTVDACLKMNPLEMAQKSEIVQESFKYIIATVNEIQDSALREAVLGIVNNPAPTVMSRYAGEGDVRSMLQRLADKGFIQNQVLLDGKVRIIPPFESPQKAAQPWLSAPGSGYSSHHSYPGGLSTHTAANLKIALSIHRTYSEVYRYKLSKDVVIAAQTLHDLHKPWVFQWQQNGASLPEASIGGQGAHHVLSIAESIYRDLPPEVVVAQACAHNHPGTPKDEADVVGWIIAAGIIAGKDPVSLGLLDSSGTSLPSPHRQEGYVTHLGDHDYVLSVPAAQKSIAALKNIARQEYGMSDSDLTESKFFQFRNYISSQLSMMTIHHQLSNGGEQAVAKLVKSVLAV